MFQRLSHSRVLSSILEPFGDSDLTMIESFLSRYLSVYCNRNIIQRIMVENEETHIEEYVLENEKSHIRGYWKC